MNKKINIIYEDKDILVIDKQDGLIVESDKKGEKTLENILDIELPRSGIVHRLDKDTSGLMVVAKNEKSLVNLQNQFASKKVRKIYYALVFGKLEPKEGTIDLALKRDPKNRTRFIASRAKDAREAVTHYEVEHYVENSPSTSSGQFLSFLKIKIETGRTHQIRAHFFAIGYPVIGDQIYKNVESQIASEKIGLKRQFLHAGEIEFAHPRTGKKMNFKVDLPEDLKRILEKCTKG